MATRAAGSMAAIRTNPAGQAPFWPVAGPGIRRVLKYRPARLSAILRYVRLAQSGGARSGASHEHSRTRSRLQPNVHRHPPSCPRPCRHARVVRLGRMRIHQRTARGRRERRHPAMGRWPARRCRQGPAPLNTTSSCRSGKGNDWNLQRQESTPDPTFHRRKACVRARTTVNNDPVNGCVFRYRSTKNARSLGAEGRFENCP